MLHPIARGMQQGQTVLRRPRTAAWALAAGLASWAAQIGGIYAALEAADIHATIGTAGLVFLVSTLVQLFPFWPGNIGLFQAAVAQVLVQAYPIDFPPRDRVRGRPAGDRGRLGVGLGFWFLSREGLSLSEVRGLRDGRLRPDARRGVTRAPARSTAFVGGTSPRAGEGVWHIRVDMQWRWDASPRRCAAARRPCWPSRCSRSPHLTLPADAARRPPGPAQAAPKPRAVVHTAKVPFRWQKAKRAQGYDLRVARDRGFKSQMQTVRLRGAKAQLLLLPGRWFWKVRSAGKINSRWSNIRQVVVRPKGDPYPPTRPTALRVTAVAENSVTVTFGASKDNRAVTRYELLAGKGKVRRARRHRSHHRAGARLRDDVRLPRARARRRRPRVAGLAGRTGAHARLHRSRSRRPRPPTSAPSPSPTRASPWPGIPRSTPTAPCAATPSTATACCSASRPPPASSRAASRPSTPYRFTVAAIDGAGPPLARRRAGHRHAGAAPRDRPGLRLPARLDRPQLRGPAAPLPPDRGRLADLLLARRATSRSRARTTRS